MLAAGYVLDGQMNGALRVQHLVGQFTSFASYRSVEDAMSDMDNLAEFGSDRGAQIIPKIELLTSTQKLMLGFGFLHNELTTNDDYIIHNEYYSDQSAAEEVLLFSDGDERLTVPVIAVVTGEGSSGGALALGVANHILMLENAVYSVLSPEGFASILWKDSSRSGEACEMMKLTAQDLYNDCRF